MRTRLLVVLGLLTFVAVAASCRTEDNANDGGEVANTSKADNSAAHPDPEPDTNPQRAGPSPWEDWIHHSPIRENMRRFWVDMGLIVANSARPEVAEMEYLDSAAADIERRAGRIAAFWKAIRDRASASVTKARADDWDGAFKELDELHHECGNCHYEYWSQAARAYIPATLKAWSDNGTPFGNNPWGEQVFTAPPKVRKSMGKLRDDMNASYRAHEAGDLSAFNDNIRAMYEVAKKQFQTFDAIARDARQIQKAATTGDLSSVETHYRNIAARCITCHANTADGRARDPLPWKAARDE
ncbi:MAG: hypothetical protein ACYTDT_02370 [Planctomycetota bacterium]|jgi:cytochrome c556